MSIKDGKGKVDLLGVTRSAQNTVTVRLNVVNEGDAAFSVYDILADPNEAKYEANGITLIDAVANKRYYPLRTTDGKCLCSNTAQTSVEPGKPAQIFAMLPAPPAETKSLTVGIPLTAAFPAVPIGDGPAPAVPGATVDPAKAQLGQPKILSLISTVEGDGKAVDDDGADEKIRLSSDVLFALNKANINTSAKSVLTDVAKRIDQSPGNLVKVDGHADNTGNDAINEPLSQRRAQAVEKELKGLVTRPGVTYQSAGHGSKEPIADNATPEGRQRNRRVTVAFTKPAPPKPPAAPAPPPSPAAGSPVATLKPQDAQVRSVKAEVTEFRRDSSGLVTMRWRQTNSSATTFWATTYFNNPVTKVFYFQKSGTHGVTLHDETNRLRYYNVRDQSGICVCTNMTFFAKTSVSQGETTEYFNTFKLPAEMKSVNIEVPGYEEAKNIPIS